MEWREIKAVLSAIRARGGRQMTVKDYGPTISFFEGYVKIGEIHYTDDYGTVCVIHPGIIALRHPKFISSLDIIKPEYRQQVSKIFEKYMPNRVSVAR